MTKVKSIAEAQEKIAELNVNNKPTEAEINDAVNTFNVEAANFNSKLFAIGNGEKAPKVYEFVLNFLQHNVYWTKNGWMGVLKMFEELTETYKTRKEDEPFQLGYNALEFLFYALTNPGGTGIETAKAIEKVAEIYIEVMEIAGGVLEEARKELKEIQWLQDKVNAMRQGFYLEREDSVQPEEEIKVPMFPSPTVDDLIKK